MAFNVTKIIDGATIEVGGWKWGDSGKGNIVRINELSSVRSDPTYNSIAKSKLESLIKDKSVDLVKAEKIETLGDQSILYCSVNLQGINIAEYFPELRQAH
jgi:hypothetical protein